MAYERDGFAFEAEWFDAISKYTVPPAIDLNSISREFGRTPWDPQCASRIATILSQNGVRNAMLPLSSCLWLYGGKFSESTLCFFVVRDQLVIGFRGRTKAVPLGRVKQARFVNGKSDGYASYVAPQYGGEKSVVAGAVIGGAIAGPAGAVVGAINNKGKQKLLFAGGTYSTTSKALQLEIEEFEIIVPDIIHKTDKVGGGVLDRAAAMTDAEKINSDLGSSATGGPAMIMSASRYANMTDEEKRALREEQEAKNAAEYEERSKKLKKAVVIGGVVIAIVAVVLIISMVVTGGAGAGSDNAEVPSEITTTFKNFSSDYQKAKESYGKESRTKYSDDSYIADDHVHYVYSPTNGACLAFKYTTAGKEWQVRDSDGNGRADKWREDSSGTWHDMPEDTLG